MCFNAMPIIYALLSVLPELPVLENRLLPMLYYLCFQNYLFWKTVYYLCFTICASRI